jgi:hypothetical protein
MNIRTNFKCVDGWNKRELSNHIGKVLDLKNGIFKLFTDVELEEFRSVWYLGMADNITSVYQVGFIDDTGINFISVESPKNLSLW